MTTEPRRPQAGIRKLYRHAVTCSACGWFGDMPWRGRVCRCPNPECQHVEMRR